MLGHVTTLKCGAQCCSHKYRHRSIAACILQSAYLHGHLHRSSVGQGACVELGLDLKSLQCMLQEVIQHSNAILQTAMCTCAWGSRASSCHHVCPIPHRAMLGREWLIVLLGQWWFRRQYSHTAQSGRASHTARSGRGIQCAGRTVDWQPEVCFARTKCYKTQQQQKYGWVPSGMKLRR